MAFSQAFIQELKMRSPVADVISRYVELKRAGRNLVGRCPFHSEKTPSFTVFEENFHCFGCSAGGDVITFIMRIENLDYKDAVTHLADRCGMTVPQEERHFVPKKQAVLTRERAFSMNKAAARIFYENLLSPEGEEARQYFAKRQLSGSTIKRFGLGFAKNSFTDLLFKLKDQGYSVDEIKANFLCGISQKNGKPFDMFRNRVMFPIIDTTGNIIAFGGRVLDDSKPKYINTSDTTVFNKGRNLFALNYAKDVLLGNYNSELVSSGEIIICEGYMDVISLHQAGFTNAVATLGTAITPDHARLISRYAKTAYLAYDFDGAGRKANDKAMQLLSEVGIDVKIISLYDAKDPDDFIKLKGVGAFKELLKKADGQIDFEIKTILNKHNLKNPNESVKAVEECCKVIVRISSPVKREVFIKRLSQMAEIKPETIEAMVKKFESKTARKQASEDRENRQKQMMHFNDRVNPEAVMYPRSVEIEERILGIMLLYPEEYAKCNGIRADDFVTEFSRRVFSAVTKLFDEGITDISSLAEEFSQEEMSRIFDMKFKRSTLTTNGTLVLNEQIDALKKEKAQIGISKKSVSSDDDLMSIIANAKKKQGVGEE